MPAIADFNYGRSKSGINALKTEFEKDMNKAMKTLNANDVEYKKMVKCIKDNWSGTDADKFIQLLDQQRAALYNKFSQYKHYMCNALDNDFKNFQRNQSNNAQKISSSINIKK